MKKYLVSILTCIVLLGGLGGLYIYNNARQAALEAATTPTPYEPISITLNDLDRGSLRKLESVHKGVQMTFLRDENDRWIMEGYEDVPLVQSAVRDIANGLCGVFAVEKLFEEAEDLAGFGLAPEQTRHTITLQDGTQATMRLGSMTSARDYYYMMLDDDPALYLIYKVTGDRFSKTMDELIDKTMAEVDPANVTHVSIQARGNALIQADLKTPEMLENTNQDALVAMSTLQMVSPVQGKEMYLMSLNSLVMEPLANVVLEGMVCEATEANLSAHGLDDPAFELVVEGDGYRYHLTIGNDVDANGTRAYAVYEGLPFIYEISLAAIKPMYEITAFKLMDRFVSLMFIDRVDEIIIQSNEKSLRHEVALNHSLVPSETEGEAPKDIIEPEVNGQAVQESAFRTFYQVVIGMAYDSLLEEYEPSGRPALVITYKLNDGSVDVVDEYYDYDAHFYAIVKGETGAFLINKQYVDAMLGSVDELLAGNFDR